MLMDAGSAGCYFVPACGFVVLPYIDSALEMTNFASRPFVWGWLVGARELDSGGFWEVLGQVLESLLMNGTKSGLGEAGWGGRRKRPSE